MTKISADVCAVTHAGRVRKDNEDNYSLNGKLTYNGELKKGSAYVQKMVQPFHLAVCDGMGGEANGETASGIAIETIAANAKSVYESGEDFSFAIAGVIDEANAKICKEISSSGERMGTTTAGIYAVEGRIICVSIGDTRIYRYSNGNLEQMSFDHTHAQEAVDAGAVPQARISSIPDAKRLTKHLGVFPDEATLSPNISVIDDAATGDVIFICSDGLTDMVSNSEMADLLANNEGAQDVTGKLIKKALEKGGKDNITVISAVITATESAIFVPAARSVVGSGDADYEEEYQNSFGNAIEEQGEEVSPYANADSQALAKRFDMLYYLRIVVIVLIILGVLTVGAFMIKTAITKYKQPTPVVVTEATTEVSTTQLYTVANDDIIAWDIDISGAETTEPTTEDLTEKEVKTTKKKVETTAYKKVTKKVTTTAAFTKHRDDSTTTTQTETTTVETTVAETTQQAEETTAAATEEVTTAAAEQ